jgi:hypothetical protein
MDTQNPIVDVVTTLPRHERCSPGLDRYAARLPGIFTVSLPARSDDQRMAG